MLGLMVCLMACNGQSSSFTFALQGDTTARVTSGSAAHGSVNDAGYLSLDDGAWSIEMSLGGLAPGSHEIAKNSGDLTITRDDTGQAYRASLGGSCTVWVDAHGSSNGDSLVARFDCTGIRSTSGAAVDVSGGALSTHIDDSANDLTKPAGP